MMYQFARLVKSSNTLYQYLLVRGSIDFFVENKNNNSLGKARNTYRRPVGDMLVGLSSVGPPYEARKGCCLIITIENAGFYRL